MAVTTAFGNMYGGHHRLGEYVWRSPPPLGICMAVTTALGNMYSRCTCARMRLIPRILRRWLCRWMPPSRNVRHQDDPCVAHLHMPAAVTTACEYVCMLLICIASPQAAADTVMDADTMDPDASIFGADPIAVVRMLACAAYLSGHNRFRQR